MFASDLAPESVPMVFMFLNGWKTNQKKNNASWQVQIIWSTNFDIHK